MKEIMEASTYKNGEVVEMQEIANITHTKRNLCRLLKMVIFILCLTGFGFQTTEFLTTFYSYPTVINIGIENMEDFPTPALTFCSKYLYRFDKYCEMLNDKCENDTTEMKTSCAEHNFICIRNKTNEVTPISFTEIEKLDPLNISEAFLFGSGEHYEGPFLYHIPGQSASEVCYRTGNGLTSTGFHKMLFEGGIMDLWGYIMVSFNQSENINFHDLPYGTLYVHSPLLAFKFYSKSIAVKKHHVYRIHIRLEEERLLPSPYETDCVDYIALWKKNNMTGPLSREMCQHGCLRKSKEYFENGVDFGSDNRLCEKIADHKDYYDPRFEDEFNKCKCSHDCKDECLKLNYDVSSYEKVLEPWYGSGDEVKIMAVIELYIESSKVRVISYKPQYMDVELFSYVGGFLGCWMGISIWTSTGILWKEYSSLVTNIKEYRNTLKRRKSSKKKTTYL